MGYQRRVVQVRQPAKQVRYQAGDEHVVEMQVSVCQDPGQGASRAVGRDDTSCAALHANADESRKVFVPKFSDLKMKNYLELVQTIFKVPWTYFCFYKDCFTEDSWNISYLADKPYLFKLNKCIIFGGK